MWMCVRVCTYLLIVLITKQIDFQSDFMIGEKRLMTIRMISLPDKLKN